MLVCVCVCVRACVQMMRRMCMGQCKDLQDVLHIQRFNARSYNFLSNVVNYLATIEPELANAIMKKDWELVDGAFRGFLMISDAMAGPNRENQKVIADTGIFDLCDRILARIRYEPVTPTDDQAEVWLANDYRQKIKTAVARTLSGFLEGVSSDELPNQMLALLNWNGLIDQMRECYTTWEVYKEVVCRLAYFACMNVDGRTHKHCTCGCAVCTCIAQDASNMHVSN